MKPAKSSAMGTRSTASSMPKRGDRRGRLRNFLNCCANRFPADTLQIAPPPMISEELLALLCCPRCHSGLIYDRDNNALICQGCGTSYEVKDDIPVLIPSSSNGAPRD